MVEKHFMVGHSFTYYVLTDQPAAMPRVYPWEDHTLVCPATPRLSCPQNVSMQLVEIIRNFSQQCFLYEVDYLVCVNMALKFSDHMGMEFLSPLLEPCTLVSSGWPMIPSPRSTSHIPRPTFPEMRVTSTTQEAFWGVSGRGSPADLGPSPGDGGLSGHWGRGRVARRELPEQVSAGTQAHQGAVLEHLWDLQWLGQPQVTKKLRFMAVPNNHQDIRDS
ncbi:unnamed protein product [Gulo gulo]|uniref:Uncharacterized protein n=1 Tax=Gulo gulo TaxID=48420 RepID=A0A9X9PW15_GULGU|nr:unnamed protein product [Gulo gulo]